MKSLSKTLLVSVALTGVLAAGAVQAGTLENLERERAILVENMLSPSLTSEERMQKVNVSKHRLVDLERMVLRDQSLIGKNRPVVRKAFENYDLTFLVHSSIEKGFALADHWLEQVGLSTHSLMNARMGNR
ncbi:MAG: hypothetical protein MI741_20220 [Rhodospirillales bacterium]|nr:hypothetical protein [Rhodospirillales bacterium]